jgi:hypothetical protein
VQTTAVAPYIFPKLVEFPLSMHTRALKVLARIAGPDLGAHLGTILPVLLAAMSGPKKAWRLISKKAAKTVVLAINDKYFNSLISHLLRGIKDNKVCFHRLVFWFNFNFLYLFLSLFSC